MVFNMDKKWTIPIIIVLAALFVLTVAYIGDNPDAINHSGEKMSFNVSSGSSELSNAIKTIKTSPYYEGYNEETVKWMESLGNKWVFFGNDTIVIMDSVDEKKIPEAPFITDVYIYDHFTAEVVESHDLGDEYQTVYYVQNVKYDGQEIIGTGLA